MFVFARRATASRRNRKTEMTAPTGTEVASPAEAGPTPARLRLQRQPQKQLERDCKVESAHGSVGSATTCHRELR
jgi:hypothetical protein